MRIHHKLGSLKVFYNHLTIYPTPANLNYSYSFGSLAGVVLVCQIVTGILLAMHYTPDAERAFSSVVHLMYDVNNGALIRYLHANGASMFFIVVYFHIARGLYYSSGSSPRELVWISGVVILVLMILTAFIGYVLPYGQMSLWGATVITSLATVIPVIGGEILGYLWGGYSVGHPTLNRFYSLHYTLPFILAALSIFHIAALHQYGSTNPLGVNTQTSTVPFGEYFLTKDIIGLLYFFIGYLFLVFFYPEMLGHPDNNIPANPYSTPAHIVPEWYLLSYYAILRSIPNKALGVVAMGLVFVSLILMPLLSSISTIGSPKFRIISERFFWVAIADVFLLTVLGAAEIMPFTVLMGQVCACIIFLYFLVIYPLVPMIENTLYTSK